MELYVIVSSQEAARTLPGLAWSSFGRVSQQKQGGVKHCCQQAKKKAEGMLLMSLQSLISQVLVEVTY